MRPQKAQTTQTELDDVIDRVASRLTHVEDDPMFAKRIIASLPERRRAWRSVWRLAMVGAAAAVAMIVLRTFNDGSPDVLRSNRLVVVASLQPAVARAIVELPSVRRTIVEPSLNDRRTDHERSLPPLSVAALTEDALPAEGALSLEPLSVPSLPVADLPLTAETFPEK